MRKSRSLQLLCTACTFGFFTMAILGATLSASADGFNWHSLAGQDWLTPARGQHYGDCHVFACFSQVESKYKLTRNDPLYNPDMSEWHYIHIMEDHGYMPGVVFFADYGIVGEVDSPYDPLGQYNQGGWPLPTGAENRLFKAVDAGGVSSGGSAADLKTQLKAYGPTFVRLSTSVDLFDTVSSMYSSTGRVPLIEPSNHWMALVGFQDDPSVPTGGYWILKNSWGTGWANNGYGYIPYGFLESHLVEGFNSDFAMTSPVYYTGSMATASWNGGAGGSGTWLKGSSTMWSGYAWKNEETSATFAGAGGTVTISGTAIAHGIAVNSPGYSFTGGALTVTSGGITATEDTTISSPLTIGGPQTWTVANGKTLTIGALHTIISNTTIDAPGNVTITGPIDGGGILNTYGSKPGGIIKLNSGTLTFTGASNFGGDITLTTGPLNITPAGGANTTYSGAWSGGGATTINSTGTTSIGGGASNYTGSITLQGGGTLQFVPADGVSGKFTGVISGNSPVVQNGLGTTILSSSYTNTYTGDTTIKAGALQALATTIGRGLPTNSFLRLDGGVLQSNSSSSSITFTRGIGTSGSTFQWTANGGGFSAGGRTFYIKVGGNTNPLTWGTDVTSQIVGTLRLGSKSSAARTEFQNGINLNGENRVIYVEDNSNSSSDYSQISGTISGAGTTSSLTKSGGGKLYLSTTNSYGGTTTISGGALQATLGAGIPTDSFLNLDGGVYQSNGVYTFNRSLGTTGGTFQWTATGGGFAAGNGALTVNIGDGTPLTWGTIVGQHLVGPLKLSSASATSTTTFQNDINLGGGTRTVDVDDNAGSSYDSAQLSGVLSGVGSLIKTGKGTLVLGGASANIFSGTTTIRGGTLDLNKTTGLALTGNLVFEGNELKYVRLVGANQLPASTNVSWLKTQENYSFFELLGHDQTVAGISDVSGRAVIENAEAEVGPGNSILTVNNAASCTFNGYMRDTWIGSGTLGLAKTGPGTLTLASSHISYSGGTTVSGGKLVLYDVTDANFLSRPINNNATLEFNRIQIDTIDFTGVISGAGTLIKSGDCNLTLSGPSGNTYTGTTMFSRGTMHLNKSSGPAVPGNLTFNASTSTFLYLDRPAQIGSNSLVSFSNTGGYGHMLLLGNNQTVGGIYCTNGTGVIENMQDESGVTSTGALTVNNAAACSFSGYMRDRAGGSSTGKLALVKSGAGALTLSGANITYTGGTTISGGTLVLQNVTNTTYAATNFTDNTAIEVYASSTAMTLSGIIGGSGALNKTGTYALTLSGAGGNTYTGLTTLSAGQVYLNKSTGLAIPGNVAFSGSASSYLYLSRSAQINPLATVNFNNTGGSGNFILYGNSQTVAGISCSNGLGAIENTYAESGVSNTGTLTINNAADCAYNGYLRDRSSGTSTGKLALVKSGAGKLTLAGAYSGGYTGGLTVNAGALNYSGGILPNGRYTIAGGTLDIGTRSQSIGVFQITAGAVAGTGTLTSSSAYDLRGGSVEAVLAGSSGLVKIQDSLATLKGPNTYTGATSILAGTLALTGNGQINPLSAINNGYTFLIADGEHTVGNILGAGTTFVGDSAQLTAASIVQSTLTIGGDGSSLLAAAVVPEPGALTLLMALGLLCLPRRIFRKK